MNASPLLSIIAQTSDEQQLATEVDDKARRREASKTSTSSGHNARAHLRPFPVHCGGEKQINKYHQSTETYL